MTFRVNADYVVKQASEAAGEIVTEIEKVHGPIWAGRQDICKLIISLAAAVLVGTIPSLKESLIQITHHRV